MSIYNVNGDKIRTLCFNRDYTYLSPSLLCERKNIQNDGTFTDSTTRCVIHLPNHGTVEVKQQRNSAMFKVVKISGNTVTWLDSDWSYYTTRYVSDGTANYYALVAATPDGTSAITSSEALERIAVYQFYDVGEFRLIETMLHGKTVAFMGDSITQGRFRKMASEGLTWTATKPFGSLVAEFAGDMNYGNYGIGGACVTTIITPWMSLITNVNKVTGYDVVFICGGTNDYGNNASASQFTSDYTTIVQTLKANNSEVIACTPVYRTSKTSKNTQGLYLIDYCNIIKDIASAQNIGCIDLYTLTNDGIFIGYCPDGLHPNEFGHEIMADYIIEEYDKLHSL